MGLFFIGTLEAVFVMAVLGMTLILRRDFNRKFVVLAGGLLCIIIIWAVLGYLRPLYENNHNLDALIGIISGKLSINTISLDALTTGRWTLMVDAMKNIQILGYGYSLTPTADIVHNIPLVIVQQIGIPAAIAWTFVTAYCLFKTKWTYAWIGVIAMSVFDHYLWGQFAPYWWCLVGVSLTSDIKTDRIFRRAE
jgi:hypothetical protein